MKLLLFVTTTTVCDNNNNERRGVDDRLSVEKRETTPPTDPSPRDTFFRFPFSSFSCFGSGMWSDFLFPVRRL
jgi:hypothetical protein